MKVFFECRNIHLFPRGIFHLFVREKMMTSYLSPSFFPLCGRNIISSHKSLWKCPIYNLCRVRLYCNIYFLFEKQAFIGLIQVIGIQNILFALFFKLLNELLISSYE